MGALAPVATASDAAAAGTPTASDAFPSPPYPRRRTLALAGAGALAARLDADGALPPWARAGEMVAPVAVAAAPQPDVADPDAGRATALADATPPLVSDGSSRSAESRLPLPRPGLPIVAATEDAGAAAGPLPRRRPASTRLVADAAERRYAVQVGAFADRKVARRSAIRAGARLPDEITWAAIDIAPVRPGRRSLYQARLTGFDRMTAEQACAHLRRARLPCLVVQAGTG